MTERRTDRELAAQLLELYLEPAPSYRFDVLAQTRQMQQRPRWTFPERWLPMVVLSRTRVLNIATPPRRAIALLLILALVIGAVLVSIAGAPHYPPPFGIARNGEIVYARGGDIFARDSIDSPARLLIGGDAADRGPWFSRRGDRFIFFREIAPDTVDVYVADADGSDIRRVGGPFMDLDTWDVTPDGTMALISGRREHLGMWTIQLLPLDGGAPRVLDLPNSAIWPRFRPGDGSWFSFRMGDPEASGEMYLVRTDFSDLRKLDLAIDGIGGGNDFTHGMDWSVDGRRFAFVSLEKDTPESGENGGLRIDIATVDPDGTVTGQRRVEFDPTKDHELNPNFVPDTDQLLFNTREGIIDYVSIGTPGVPGGTILKPGSTKEQGIDYQIAPDGKTALVLNWGEKKTYVYDLVTLQSREVELGPDDVTTYQRLAP